MFHRGEHLFEQEYNVAVVFTRRSAYLIPTLRLGAYLRRGVLVKCSPFSATLFQQLYFPLTKQRKKVREGGRGGRLFEARGTC